MRKCHIMGELNNICVPCTICIVCVDLFIPWTLLLYSTHDYYVNLSASCLGTLNNSSKTPMFWTTSKIIYVLFSMVSKLIFYCVFLAIDILCSYNITITLVNGILFLFHLAISSFVLTVYFLKLRILVSMYISQSEPKSHYNKHNSKI